MAKLSFVVLLAALISFCAAQTNEIGDNKELLGYLRNAEANWDQFMVRLLRELNLPEKPSPSIDEKQEQGVGVEDVVKANGGKANRASQSCSSTTGCTATASETNTSSSGSSTGTSSTSTSIGTSSSSSSGTSSSTSTGTGSSSSSSSSGSSSSSSSGSSSSSSSSSG